MFINFKTLNKFQEQFSFHDLLYLCAVKQQDEESIKEIGEKISVIRLLEHNYIKTLKNGELRLDKKGTEFLKNVSKSDEITEDTERLCEWLVQVYKGREDGIVKNKQELKRRCNWFQDQTGIYKNKLAVLLQCFIQDSYTKESNLTIQEFKEQNPRMVLSNLLDNVFWKPKDNFARHYNLTDSPLYQYYEDNKEYIESVWKSKNLE